MASCLVIGVEPAGERSIGPYSPLPLGRNLLSTCCCRVQAGLRGRGDDDVLPPYQEDLLAQYGVDPVAASQGHWSPYSMTATPTGRSWTRTFTAPDGTVITEVPSSTVLYRGVTFSPKKWGRGYYFPFSLLRSLPFRTTTPVSRPLFQDNLVPER